MQHRAIHGYAALTEKEKQALRLIVRGHDAKSTARELGLSVHTINERLRDARRKLAVSSSREAARLVFEREDRHPENLADTQIGAASSAFAAADPVPPENGTGRARRIPVIAGVATMSVMFAIAAALLVPQATPAPGETASSAPTRSADLEAAARHFLTLIDQGNWRESYAMTADSFHKLNTLQLWTQVSQQVRPPLGAMRSRMLLTQESVPAPPNGVEVLKFRTSFANKPDATEKVSLAREDGQWRVVGIYIE